jgi:hypothetical protein
MQTVWLALLLIVSAQTPAIPQPVEGDFVVLPLNEKTAGDVHTYAGGVLEASSAEAARMIRPLRHVVYGS